MLSFKPTFLLSSFTFNERLLSSSSLSAVRVCHLALKVESQNSEFTLDLYLGRNKPIEYVDSLVC